MTKVILQIDLAPDEVSVSAVKHKLGLKSGQIDHKFGVTPVRPERGHYAVRVDPAVAHRVRQEPHADDAGHRRARGDVRVALVH